MLDNEVYLKYGPYRRIRRNALANIMEGLNQEAVNWLSKNIAHQSNSVDHRCEKYTDEENSISGDEGDDENENDDDDDDDDAEGVETVEEKKDGKYSAIDEEKSVLNQEKNEGISYQNDSELNKADCFRRLSSPMECRFQSSFAAIRRNALHNLLETLTPAEITTLGKLYQLEHSVKDLTLEQERFDHLMTPTQYPYIETYFDKYLTQV
uniref:Uncharacterized protein n=1 Tax=Octopus bimaculoides TaxID=37653 RepID=A0A0L8HRC2_OCTBM